MQKVYAFKFFYLFLSCLKTITSMCSRCSGQNLERQTKKLCHLGGITTWQKRVLGGNQDDDDEDEDDDNVEYIDSTKMTRTRTMIM